MVKGMKNEGYTLVELLVVFVILGVIIMISVPLVSSSINFSKDNSYDEQVKILENAARIYMSKNSVLLPNDGESYTLTVSTLKESGLIPDRDIKNSNYYKSSEDNKKKCKYFDGEIIVTNTNNKFYYNYRNNDKCVR